MARCAEGHSFLVGGLCPDQEIQNLNPTADGIGGSLVCAAEPVSLGIGPSAKDDCRAGNKRDAVAVSALKTSRTLSPQLNSVWPVARQIGRASCRERV